jgi:hypothetical protein
MTTRMSQLGEQLMTMNEARVQDSLHHLVHIRRDT